MSGFFPHFIMGHALFLSSYVILTKTSVLNTDDQKISRNYVFLLYGACVLSSIIPDFPLGLYYLFHVGSFSSLLPIHAYLHQIITPTAFVLFLLLSVLADRNYRPIWAMGLVSILIHVLMDYYLEEMGVWW